MEQSRNMTQVMVVQDFRMAEGIGGQEVHGVQLDEACMPMSQNELQGFFSLGGCVC